MLEDGNGSRAIFALHPTGWLARLGADAIALARKAAGMSQSDGMHAML